MIKANNKTLLIIGVILAILTIGVGYQLYTKKTEAPTTTGATQVVENKALAISFSYNGGEDAFTLVEPPENQAGIQKAYVLMPTAAYNDYKNSEDAREAPAGMSIFILKLDEGGNTENATTAERADRMTRLKDWAVRFDGLTQYSQKKAEPEEVEIDGLKALKYQADGLYQQTIYLATYKNNVYMFVSQYNEQSDITYTSFDALLGSVSFN